MSSSLPDRAFGDPDTPCWGPLESDPLLFGPEALAMSPRWPAPAGAMARAAALETAVASPDRLLAAARRAAARPAAPPRLMGIVNATPDSFSDGGRYLEPERAIEHGLRLAAEGATYVDVGGESTRPGSEPVAAAEELRRVIPVIAGLARELPPGVAISVDTQKAAVARAALDAGATIVNDVSAGRADPALLPLVGERGAGFVAMHMQGEPRTMQRDPRYADVVAEVLAFLRARVAACLQAGIGLPKIAVDPGIGFGKRLEHNLTLLGRLSELRCLGLPILMGVSRKSMIALVERDRSQLDVDPDRLGGTVALVATAVLGGADVLRVHDVAVCGQAARVAAAIRDIALGSTSAGTSS